MSFVRIRDLTRSLSFRLTVWYAGLLLLALGLSFAISYVLVSSLAVRRVDAYLRGEAEECDRLYQLQGVSAVEEEARTEMHQTGSSDVYFRLLDGEGKMKFESDTADWKGLAINLQPLDARGEAPLFQTTVRHGSKPEVRLIAVRLSAGHYLIIAASMNSDLRLVRESMRLVMFVMLTAWLLAAVLGLVLARRALRGIHAVQEAAAHFTGGKTGSRVSYPRRGDEIDRLARSFNLMADRIEALVHNLRDTNDNLAHELRSPITRIRARCELALTHGTRSPDFPALTADMIEECDRMLGVISNLLEISETQAGAVSLASRELNLRELLASACDMFGPLAEDRRVALTLVPGGPAMMTGDTAKLQRLFSNLLDNALKFTPAGGAVKIILTQSQESLVVLVQDTGPGIPPDEMQMVFERFVRGSAAKGQPGNGLGLSLARTIARAHGGDITVRSEPGKGAEFSVTLPRRDCAAIGEASSNV